MKGAKAAEKIKARRDDYDKMVASSKTKDFKGYRRPGSAKK